MKQIQSVNPDFIFNLKRISPEFAFNAEGVLVHFSTREAMNLEDSQHVSFDLDQSYTQSQDEGATEGAPKDVCHIHFCMIVLSMIIIL